MKKIFIILGLIILTCTTAYADDIQTIDPAFEINLDYYDNKALCDYAVLFGESIESTFHHAIKEHELILIDPGDGIVRAAIRIDLSAYNLDVSTEEKYAEVEAVIYDLSYQSLEYFYLDSKLYPYVEDNVMTNLFFVVRSDFTGNGDLASQQATLDNYINMYNLRCAKILADVLYPDMTQAEIALALHSYLGDSLYYDNNFEALSYTSYSAIMGEKAVCQGYSFAYEHLLRLAGIDGVIATSSDMNHAWNVICIDGKWYHADPTRDDRENYGVTHRYFLLSDETIKARGHYNWTSSVSCSSKDYETGYFFNPEYTDALYSSDFMTCRRNSEGYFLYMRNKKYYKSILGGSTEEITEEEYNYDKSFAVKLSAPFVYTDESFSFASGSTDNVILAIINQSDSEVTGNFIAAYYDAAGITHTKTGSGLTLSPGEYLFCNLNSAAEHDYIKMFFWDNSLKPHSKTLCAE